MITLMTSLRKPLLYLSLLIGLDQFSKYLVRTGFYPGESVSVTPFFHLTYVTNTGVAFSMFQGANTFFAVFAALVLLGFAAWYLKNRASLDTDTLVKTALLLIVAGAVGNLIDRLLLGYVIDFLDFSIGSYHWPSFNLADSCITAGGIVLFFRLIFAPKAPAKKLDGAEVKE